VELVRILLDLILSDHAPLVNASVRLLLRHFNQRQDLVNAFNQVQLLVSTEEVENYRDIKEALDALKLVVESKLDRVVQLRSYGGVHVLSKWVDARGPQTSGHAGVGCGGNAQAAAVDVDEHHAPVASPVVVHQRPRRIARSASLDVAAFSRV